jgi:hypothetical protein
LTRAVQQCNLLSRPVTEIAAIVNAIAGQEGNMPPFRITVEKYDGRSAEFWTNVYWGAGSTVLDFTADIATIVNAEKALYDGNTTITKVRVDDAVQGTDNYRTYVYNVVGTYAPGAGNEFVAPFVVGRVDFETGTGRPSRKYLRHCLYEADIAGMNLSAGAITRLNAYATSIVGTAAIVDVDGQDFVSGAAFPKVAMRQLRRGSKKKLTP